MSVVIAKFIHVIAIAAWSAGLIALPFLYLQRRRLTGNALFRLHAFTRFFYVTLVSPAAFVAIASGTVLIFLQQTFTPWFSVKLGFVGFMVIIHVMTGLMILKLFEPSGKYPFWRFIGVTVLTIFVVCAVLVTVLGKPEFGPVPALDAFFAPGALKTMLGNAIAWLR